MLPLSASLNRLIRAKAHAIPYSVVPERVAPSSYEQLRAAFKRTGVIPVSDAASDRTIYGDAETNYAMRAWHDATHLALGADFSIEGEIATARAQCALVDNIRDKALLWADTAGQLYYFARWKEFPTDQRAFVLYWLATGQCDRKS